LRVIMDSIGFVYSGSLRCASSLRSTKLSKCALVSKIGGVSVFHGRSSRAQVRRSSGLQMVATTSSSRKTEFNAVEDSEARKGTAQRPFRIALLEGDGAGPEVIKAALKVLAAVEQYTDLHFDVAYSPYGLDSLAESGDLVPESTILLCKEADAVLRGYQGSSRFTPEHSLGQLSAHSILKEKLDLFAQLRPVKMFEPLLAASRLKPEYVEGTDMMIVREIAAGALPASKVAQQSTGSEASSSFSYTKSQVDRIAALAVSIAEQRSGRILNVDKADAMVVSSFWREKLHDYFSKKMGKRQDLTLSDMFVDDFCREVVLEPNSFDVIVTSNLFGDILSEVASGITGSMRLSPSAWLSESGLAVYGPADLYNSSAYPKGSSVPEIKEKQSMSNPIATIRAMSMMLRYSLEEPAAADLIQTALNRVLAEVVPRDAASYFPDRKPVSAEEFAEALSESFAYMHQYEMVCDPEICGD